VTTLETADVAAAVHRTSALVRPRDITPAFLEAWRDLAGRAVEPNPFAEPETVVPAMTHLAGRSRVGLLTVARAGRLEAVLPVTWLRVPVARGVSLPVPLLQAWVDPYMQLATPLLDADAAVPAMAALLRPPSGAFSPALLWRYFPEGGPVAAALDTALAQQGREAVRLKTYERALLVREGAPAPSKNRKRRYGKLRDQLQVMADELGPVEILDRAADPAAVEEFLRLEAAGWKGTQGTALASNPAHAAWLREVCDGLRAAGRLELPVLTVGGRTVAMACNFGAGDGCVHLRSAYDETLGEHRPGAQLVRHWAETMAEGPFGWRDSLTVPDNELFNQLWSSRRTLSTVVVPLGRTLGPRVVAAARWAAGLRNREPSAS
jgi:hypothetical protein